MSSRTGWLTVTFEGGGGADCCFCVQPGGKSRIKLSNEAAAVFFIRAKVVGGPQYDREKISIPAVGAALEKGRAVRRCSCSKSSDEKDCVESATEIMISPDAAVVSLILAACLYQSGLRISDRLPGRGM